MADKKITELDALAVPLDDDVLPIVNDPAGVPVTKKVTLAKISSPRLLATVAGIDATAVAITSLFTVPAGKSLIVDHIVIRVTAFTIGGKLTEAEIVVGANDPDYNDLTGAGGVTIAVDAADICIPLGTEIDFGGAIISYPIYAADSVLKINITIASDADVEVWAVDVFGYLVL